MSTANVTQTGQAATVSVTVSRGLPGATGATGAPGTTDYNELNNVPTEFPPSAHDHVVSDITPVSSQHLIGRHANGTGDAQEVTVSGGLEFSGSGIQIADTAVTAAEYTAPTITVDSKGRITAAESVTYETPAGVDAKIEKSSRRLANKIAILGDSITEASSTTDNRTSLGYGAWIQNLSEGRIQLLTNTTQNKSSFAASGFTAAQIRATYVPQLLIDYKPGTLVFVYAGTNSVFQNATQENTINDMIGIVDDMLIGGIPANMILTSPIYARTSGAETAPQIAVRVAANAAYVAAMQQRNVRIYDWRAIMEVGGFADPTWLKVSDNVHPSIKGAKYLGEQTLNYIAQNWALRPYPLTAAVRAAAINSNPSVTGDVSGVATNWTVASSAGATATPTKVARTDAIGGEWQQIAFTAENGSITKFINFFRTANITTVSGQRYRGVVEIEYDSAGWDGQHAHILLNNVTNARTAFNGEISTTPVGCTQSILSPTRQVLITEPVLVDQTLTNFGLLTRLHGNSGTVKIGFAGIVPVTSFP